MTDRTGQGRLGWLWSVFPRFCFTFGLSLSFFAFCRRFPLICFSISFRQNISFSPHYIPLFPFLNRPSSFTIQILFFSPFSCVYTCMMKHYDLRDLKNVV